MDFGTLFLIVIAGIAGLLVAGYPRLQTPSGALQIVMGIIIGNSGFKLVNTGDPVLQGLSTIGFTLLMFLVGTGLPLKQPELKGAIWQSLAATALAFAVAIPFAFMLASLTSIHNTALFVPLLACSSTAVVMPMLMEHKLEGRLVLLTTTWVAVADIGTVVALPLAMYPDKLDWIVAGTLVVTATAFTCSWGLGIFRASRLGSHYRKLSKKRGWALDLRLSLGILFGLTAIASKFGTSVLVPGFAAGAVIAANNVPSRFTKQLRGLAEGFFVPLFFVDLGAKLDFTALYYSWHFLTISASIVAASIVVHLIVAWLVKLPWPSALMASSQQGLPIALVSLGLSDKTLEPGQGAAIIAAALLLIGVAAFGTARLAKLVPPPAKPPQQQPDERPSQPPADQDSGKS